MPRICQLCGTEIGPGELSIMTPPGYDVHMRGSCPVATPAPNGRTWAPHSYRIHDDPAKCHTSTCGGCYLAE